MTDHEWRAFCESVRSACLLFLPSLIAALLVSFTDFLTRHWRKEPFSVAKLLSGLLRDGTLGVIVSMVCYGLGVPHYIRIGIVAMCVARGRDWIFDVVDGILCTKYSGYKDNYHGPEQRDPRRQEGYSGPRRRKNDGKKD